MADNVKYQLRILNLSCYRQDESDGDEVFLKIKKEKIWPVDAKYVKMKEGDHKVAHNIEGINKDETVSMELWEYDFWTPNDKLGTFSMLINERGGPFRTDLKAEKGEAAKYSLEWEVY
ncbi:hypothetical protein [Fulvivirga sp.]|uniref:hypothetical protein n=1 Tax=Fulvivirga sp. TaxID=1931237 RepID=UPI0032F05187